MLEPLNIYYQDSETMVVQGKQIKRYLKKGFSKVCGGNGSFIMTKPAVVTLSFKVDGNIYTESINNLIKDYYRTSKVSFNQANNFFNAVKSGKIVLEFSDNTLKIVRI